MNSKESISSMAQEVLEGLRQSPKRISSKFFYDDEGSRLFQEIMHLPEYYLTRSEKEIFEMEQENILQSMLQFHQHFNIIELGAGDGLKTKVLLQYFIEKQVEFEYTPIDISREALLLLENNIASEVAHIQFNPIEGDYFDTLKTLQAKNQKPKVIFFLGSNIGNFDHQSSINFLSLIRKNISHNDLLFLGFDLKKHPQVILDAYNDKAGITKAFNLNLLTRLNNELEANFDIKQFSHYPIYDPDSGEARSYLVSNIAQTVYFGLADETIVLEAGEVIHTEISRKYSLSQMQNIAQEAGFELVKTFTDKRKYFMNGLFKAK